MPRPFPVQEPKRTPTQQESENQAFQQDKFEATELQLKEKSGTITSVEQERLGTLQAKMDNFWAQRMERASRFDYNFATIPVHYRGAEVAVPIQPKLITGQQSQAISATTAPVLIQPKLTVGQPNDQYEQEADRVAEQVMTMLPPTPPNLQRQPEDEQSEEIQPKSLAEMITPIVQRQEEAADEDSPQTNCETCEQEEQVQRSAKATVQAQPGLESRLNASKSGGSPLPDEVRSFMEPRFKANFSQVRVHTDGEAVQMTRELGAQAFTHRHHIYYGAGKAPTKDDLTAHELAHVVQQVRSKTLWQDEELIVQRQEAHAEPPPANHLDSFHADPMAILRAINPGPYCRLNCPATADAFENFVRTGRVDPAHCDRDAELRGTLGYEINGRLSRGFDITLDSRGRDRRLASFLRLMERQMPAHGDVVVVEAERTEEQRTGRSGRRLSQHHYFVLVNIRGARFVVDAYLREVHPLPEFREYLNALNVTYLRYVRGEFQAVARTSDAD